MRVEYENTSSTETAFKVRLTNLGPATPGINQIQIRYFFRDDADRTATPTVVDAIWNLASSSMSRDLLPAGCWALAGFVQPPQSSYLDIACTARFTMEIGDTITMSVAIGPATQIPSNDYSYADTGGAFVANDRILLSAQGLVLSGTPPP
jgi:hypothetical protein